MTTELCTYTRNACDIARRTGVERIELCASASTFPQIRCNSGI